MTDVIAWPPFCVTGWALDEQYPQSRSVGLIEGRPRTSAAQRGRRIATAIVSGIGKDMDGAGYVRMLNRQWAGKPKLVRVEAHSTIWYLASGGLNLQNNIMEWTAGGTELLWTAGGADMIWGDGEYAISGEPGFFPGRTGVLLVSGLPPNVIVARPSELISVTDGSVTEEAYVRRTTLSNANGIANIRTDRGEPFTVSGLVSIGHRESIVFEAQGVPRSVQQVRGGDFMFTWDFREVFEDEYADGWRDFDPWV